ncbi:unnamed protein product, partial [Pylaiella littoralis]
GVAKQGSPVVVHKEPLEETMCPSRTTGVSFYWVPHFQENAYHLHNDNFMPMSSNILSTPCLCDEVTLASCNLYEKTIVRTPKLKQKHGSTHPAFLKLFESLFDHTLNLKKDTHGTNLVLFLHRNAVETGKEKTNRFMRDLGPFRQAWASHGIHMDEWRYQEEGDLKSIIGSLSGYDVYIGVHGAELTNILYGNQGLVLMEITSDGWDKEIFHKIAQARRGGYLKVRTHRGSHYQVHQDVAAETVHCALALWRRDDDRISVCTDAAPNPGPSQGHQDTPKNYAEG